MNSALDDARKRARRRLVGAIVLALIAAVVVPLFLESDPKPLGPDVQIQIPAIDDAKFQNRLTPPSKAGIPEPPVAPEAGKGPTAQAALSGGDTPKAAKSVGGAPPDAPATAPPVVAPTRPQPPSPAATTTAEAAPRATSEAKSADKSESRDNAPSDGKAVEKQPAKSADKAEKQPAKTGDKAEKQPPKTGDKAEKQPGKAADKAEKPSDKAAHTAKAAPQPAPVKAPEPATNLGTATLNTAAPASAKTGEFVVQLGAFVDKAVATELAAKAGEKGYAVYLEAVTTKSGPVQRVRVGPFPTREAADAAAAKLAAAGFTAVTRPR